MPVSNVILCECLRPDAFYPFSVMHALWELRVGAYSTIEKAQLFFPDAIFHFHGRPVSIASYRERFDVPVQKVVSGDIVILRADMLFTRDLQNHISDSISTHAASESSDKILQFESDGAMIGAYLPAAAIHDEWRNDIDRLTDFGDKIYADSVTCDFPVKILTYLWDTLDLCAEAIRDDFSYMQPTADNPALKQAAVHVQNPENISAGSNLTIAPSVVIDASNGPVVIGDDVTIMAQSTVIGPVFIGSGTTLKVGTRLYPECSIGPVCKIGGEIENSIIHGFSNKQHEGFLGHSFLGEWINIGADTNTSDLKNNYGTISVELPTGRVNTGRLFLGVLMGDHTKTGINTMINTGSTIGIASNVFGGNYCNSYLPSFSWGCKTNISVFTIERALALARTVMARRGKLLAENEELLMRVEYSELRE